jgi:toxin FitB
MSLLCDTNILSELSRRAPHPRVLAWASGVTSYVISAITVEELFFGVSAQPLPRIHAWLEALFETSCTVLPITEQIARRCGELRGELRGRGQIRSQADMMIAATAQLHGLALATRNTRDFEGCGIALLNPFE